MDQVNRAFDPDLLVIPLNSTVTFANSDTVSHQIYSFSPPKRFQLPLYRGKPYPPTRFDQAGLVTLHEGESSNGLSVAQILPDGVELTWQGQSFKVPARD